MAAKRRDATSGVYVIHGRRGLYVGQSGCLERRIPEVLSRHAGCVGVVSAIRFLPVRDRRSRLALQRELIQRLRPPGNVRRS